MIYENLTFKKWLNSFIFIVITDLFALTTILHSIYTFSAFLSFVFLVIENWCDFVAIVFSLPFEDFLRAVLMVNHLRFDLKCLFSFMFYDNGFVLLISFINLENAQSMLLQMLLLAISISLVFLWNGNQSNIFCNFCKRSAYFYPLSFSSCFPLSFGFSNPVFCFKQCVCCYTQVLTV